jgi:hypothetical protein
MLRRHRFGGNWVIVRVYDYVYVVANYEECMNVLDEWGVIRLGVDVCETLLEYISLYTRNGCEYDSFIVFICWFSQGCKIIIALASLRSSKYVWSD